MGLNYKVQGCRFMNGGFGLVKGIIEAFHF